MTFRQYLEMASFTLPQKVKIGNDVVSAVDMQFEKYPQTRNEDGKVLNQGSKFIAKIPESSKYLVYNGEGFSEIVDQENVLDFIKKGFQKISNGWWKKALFIKNEMVGSFGIVSCKDLDNPNFQI